MYARMALPVLGALTLSMVIHAPRGWASEPTTSGWSLRVCPIPSGSTLRVSLGLTGSVNTPGHRYWRTFSRSKAVQEARIDGDVSGADGVWIRVEPQGGAGGDVCLLHDARVVREFTVSARTEVEVTLNQAGDCRCGPAAPADQ